MCRVLTKNLKDPQEGSGKPGFKFSEIITQGHYAHLHNILVIAEAVPILKTQIVDNLLANQGKLLNIITPAVGDAKLPQEVKEKLRTIAEIANAKSQEEPKIVEIGDDHEIESPLGGVPSTTVTNPSGGAKAAAPKRR